MDKLKVNRVSKKYGSKVLLDNISFQLEEIVGERVHCRILLLIEFLAIQEQLKQIIKIFIIMINF